MSAHDEAEALVRQADENASDQLRAELRDTSRLAEERLVACDEAERDRLSTKLWADDERLRRADAEAALREERLNGEMLRERLTEAEKTIRVGLACLSEASGRGAAFPLRTFTEAADVMTLLVKAATKEREFVKAVMVPRAETAEALYVAAEARAKAAEGRVRELENPLAEVKSVKRSLLGIIQNAEQHHEEQANDARELRDRSVGLAMSSTRHTSPDLSRRLRDAGLEQDDAPGARYWRPAQEGHEAKLMEPLAGAFRPDGTNTDRGPAWYRALRLDEVLEELRRERTGGPLALDVSLNVHPMITTIESEAVGVHPTYARHAVPVEAAGLVLAQLLEARRG